MKNLLFKARYAMAVVATGVGSTLAMAQDSGQAITIDSPFEYSEVATTVATAAGVVLALTFGYMVAFRLVKKIIGRLAGQA